ncbi:MAG TPA: M23 family metallopeptidase [Gaiellaceae bacterium]|nr:M23 family metallopeptidase [Gaiellaceae bacterium]
MGRLVPVALALAALVASSVGPASATKSATNLTAARAFAVQVAVPGQSGSATPAVNAPPDSVGVGGSFAYPSDGSVISAGSVTYGAFANPGEAATSNASAQVSTISIFGGDVTVATVSAKARASANSQKSSADSSGSAVTGLAVLGQAVTPGSGTQFPIGDWGYVVTLQQGKTSLDAKHSAGTRAYVTGLQVRLTAEHYGLPAGTEVMIGYAEAGAKYAPAPAVAPKPKERHHPGSLERKKKHPKTGPGVGPGPERPNLTVRPPPDVTPRLTAGGYVFPVYGPSSFSDTFGAPRGDIASGWHHGDDIFGQLGEPLLAVADGTVFSVGWNDIGGYRLWLRDQAGNEFYYAHLSAYSPFAVNGNQVKAGTVLGFLGNTGDASTTPYHLHFEIHPVGLLYLGYDGAVNPTSYLMAWQRLQDIDFAQVAGWAPPISPTSSAPKPGAILLSQTDISTADGLDPESLRQALKQLDKSDGG